MVTIKLNSMPAGEHQRLCLAARCLKHATFTATLSYPGDEDKTDFFKTFMACDLPHLFKLADKKIGSLSYSVMAREEQESTVS